MDFAFFSDSCIGMLRLVYPVLYSSVLVWTFGCLLLFFSRRCDGCGGWSCHKLSLTPATYCTVLFVVQTLSYVLRYPLPLAPFILPPAHEIYDKDGHEMR